MSRKFGFSFSWKRALGISSAKARVSRMLGVPLTRSGRERKIGRMVLNGGGCTMGPLLLVIAAIAVLGLR